MLIQLCLRGGPRGEWHSSRVLDVREGEWWLSGRKWSRWTRTLIELGACGVCQGVTRSSASLQCSKGGGESWEMRSDRELDTIAFITLKAKVNLEFPDLLVFCQSPLLWAASA